MQREAAYMDPTRAAGALSRAQAQAMTAAASNTSAGPAMAFMGMGMAQQAGGINAQSLYAMGQQQQMAAQQAAPKMEAPAGGWKCSCGAVNTGKSVQNAVSPSLLTIPGLAAAVQSTKADSVPNAESPNRLQ